MAPKPIKNSREKNGNVIVIFQFLAHPLAWSVLWPATTKGWTGRFEKTSWRNLWKILQKDFLSIYSARIHSERIRICEEIHEKSRRNQKWFSGDISEWISEQTPLKESVEIIWKEIPGKNPLNIFRRIFDRALGGISGEIYG